jgi:two-component system sensor histidine kinase HydH
MKNLRADNYRIFAFSPWLLAIACTLLVALLGLFGVRNYQREVDLIEQALRQKGLTLVRFINSSARESLRSALLLSGSPGKWLDLVQNAMLQATEQPGVDFVALVARDGEVLARAGELAPTEKVDAETLKFIGELEQIPEPVVGRMATGAVGKGQKYQLAIHHLPPEFLGPGGGQEGAMQNRSPGMRRFGQHMRFSVIRDVMQQLADKHPVFLLQLDVESFNAPLKRQFLQLIILFTVLLLVLLGGALSFFTLKGLKGSQDRLGEMRAFTDLLVSSLPIGLIATDKTGTIQVCNSAASSIVGQSSAAIVGKTPEVLDTKLASYFINEFVANGGREVHLTRQGDEKHATMVALQTLQIVDSAQKQVGRVLLLRDITELKALEKKLQRSERMAALGKMAAGVAHELRNPLSSIKGLGLLLKSGLAVSDEKNQTADLLVREVERLNRSIGELLDYARPEQLTRQVTDLRPIIAKNVSLIAADAAATAIHVETDIDKELPPANIDVDKINQVLLNVLLNGVQAMPNGGNLYIHGTKEENNIAIIVSDTGVGIEATMLSRIFDPYFTTKQEGTGLGLALSLKIVEEHGGTIRVVSEPGKGSAFTIILPAA